MRENRPCGSEGGESQNSSRPLSEWAVRLFLRADQHGRRRRVVVGAGTAHVAVAVRRRRRVCPAERPDGDLVGEAAAAAAVRGAIDAVHRGAGLALVALRALDALRSLRPRRSGCALRPGNALGPGRSGFALHALRPGRTGVSLGAGRAGRTLRTLRPRCTDRPLRALRSLRPGWWLAATRERADQDQQQQIAQHYPILR